MMKTKISFTLLLALVSFSSLAETVYIDDQIKIWSRTGPSNEYKVKYKLIPGSQLEILQKNDVSDFVEVKDAQGRISWLDAQFLTTNPTANHRLTVAERNIKALKEQHSKKLQKLEKRLRELEPQESLNKELQNKMAKLRTDLERAREKGQMYESGFNSEIFFAGTVVVLGGMLLGWLLSKLGGQKRRSGWS